MKMRVIAVATILAAAGLAACNEPAGPALGNFSGTWVTRCPDGQPGCTPAFNLFLVQTGTRTDTVLGSGSITLVYPAGPEGLGRVDQTSFFRGGVTGNRLTADVRVRRTAPDFRPDSAAGTFTGTVSGSGNARTMEAILTMAPSSTYAGYTATGTLVLVNLQLP